MATHQGFVPVYLPDKTVIGTARIDFESGQAVINIQGDSSLMEFLTEQVVGLSVMYLNVEAAEEILNKEKTDDTPAEP